VNSLVKETILPAGQSLQLVQGDITAETTDAIVNAANEHLRHGAGVAGAILRRGGPAIQRESEAWIRAHGTVSHAEPAWTSGGNLACRIVIHAVGPVWGDGDEDAKLGMAIRGSLRVAEELGLSSMAFPAISTGIFGFPKERAAGVLFASIQEYLEKPSGLNLIRVVVYDNENLTAFEKAWHDHFEPKR
jgi:O-acetyl-ADP-ribose deacetylase (regulator of RNase III)